MGKVTKKSAKKRHTILQLLNDSSELSELQCPSCSKNMNSFEVLYKLEHKGSSGRHRNLPTPSDVLKNIAEELVVESIIGGAKEMEIEGCKSCKSLWLDKTNRMYLGAATILSNKKGLE